MIICRCFVVVLVPFWCVCACELCSSLAKSNLSGDAFGLRRYVFLFKLELIDSIVAVITAVVAAVVGIVVAVVVVDDDVVCLKDLLMHFLEN